jgi:hypothetical protein
MYRSFTVQNGILSLILTVFTYTVHLDEKILPYSMKVLQSLYCNPIVCNCTAHRAKNKRMFQILFLTYREENVFFQTYNMASYT